MKKLIGVACSIALMAGLALYAPCLAESAGSQQDKSSMDKSSGGGTGGSASSDASVQKSTGGATGASAGQDMGSLKKSLNNRVKAVDKEISSAKKNAGSMTQDQKDAMQLQIDQVQAKRDSVKKMISDMKRADERNTVETAMADLEQSAKQLSSSTQRSTPAGGSQDSGTSSGGATGGSSSDSSMSQGGATGGAGQTMDLNAMKKGFTDRVDKAGRDLNEVKKSIQNMQGTKKDTMKMELDKVMAKEAAAKKIIGDMKSTSEQKEVESAVADLEQSAKSLMAQTGRSTPAGDSKSGSKSSTSTSKGGATGGSSSGSSMKQESGGATGGAAGMSLNAIKQNFNDRVDKVARDLKDTQKSIKNMQGAQKDTMQLELDRIMGETAGVKKMIADMGKPEQQTEVEKAVADLESSAKKLSSQTQRSTPAGETQSGGSTGGSSMSASTDTANQGTGGMTGGSAGPGTMQFSYDQRSQFKKTANTKLNSLDKRIDMLKENAKSSPQDVNNNVMPKVDQLSKMSGDIKSKIGKVDNTDRQAWNTTRTDINDNLNKLEMSLMEAEKTIS